MRVTKSSVSLRGVRIYAFHGVLPHERTVGNWFVIDVEADVDFTRAIDTDDLADTVSYAAIHATLVRQMAQPSRLLEHVAGRMAQALLDEFPSISCVRLRLMKENPPIAGIACQGCGVTIEAYQSNTK